MIYVSCQTQTDQRDFPGSSSWSGCRNRIQFRPSYYSFCKQPNANSGCVFPFVCPTRGIKEVIKILRAPDFLRELTKSLFFSDSFALFPRGKTVSQVFFSVVLTWPNFPQQQKSVYKLHMVHLSPSRANKSSGWSQGYKTSQNVGQPLHSLAVFGLIPQSGDKSPVNLGHTRTVTKEQHRLCVLWLLLKDGRSPAGKKMGLFFGNAQ